MKALVVATALLALNANAECVLQETTVNTVQNTVVQHDNIVRDIVPYGSKQKCIVRYRALVNNVWHTTFGEYVFDDTDPASACATAIINSDKQLLLLLEESNIASQQTLVCHDDDTMINLPNTEVGTVGNVSQYRVNPERPENFFYNGTECRWFLSTEFILKNVLTHQGIICKIDNESWIVVDKF